MRCLRSSNRLRRYDDRRAPEIVVPRTPPLMCAAGEKARHRLLFALAHDDTAVAGAGAAQRVSALPWSFFERPAIRVAGMRSPTVGASLDLLGLRIGQSTVPSSPNTKIATPAGIRFQELAARLSSAQAKKTTRQISASVVVTAPGYRAAGLQHRVRLEVLSQVDAEVGSYADRRWRHRWKDLPTITTAS